MDVNENIADLTVRIQNTTEDVNGAVLEIEGKVNDSSQVIADLGRQIKKTTEVLNGDVLRLDEKFTNADVEVEGKVGVLNEEIADLGGQLNATKEKIKRLEEALEVALKVEEIQFFGVASQSSTLDPSNNNYAAAKCIDGSKSETRFCHTDHKDADPWWKLTFTNDVVINRIMIYSERRMQYTAGNKVSIFSTTGSIVWEHTIEKEEKLVYVIDVPNVVGQNVKIDKPFQPWPEKERTLGRMTMEMVNVEIRKTQEKARMPKEREIRVQEMERMPKERMPKERMPKE